MAQQPRPLFTAVTAAEDQPSGRAVARARRATVDVGQLRARNLRAADAPTLLLNLFSDVSFRAVLDRIDSTANGYVWVGHIPGLDMSSVTLAREGDALYGSIFTRIAAYVVSPVAGGEHLIAQIDQDRLPPEADPIPAPVSPSAGAGAFAESPASVSDDGSLIDVMVLYTPAAAAAAGGTSGISALISNAISTTNTTYANSAVTQRLRLVYSAQVAYTETGGSTGISTDLTNITNGTGAFAGVPALRNAYGADLVTLLTNTPGTIYCGIAWMMQSVSTSFAPNGYSVVEQGCAVGNLSFPHELGHNMGARHDWYVDGGNTTLPFSYAHGYVNTAARWRTIMSYNDVCAAGSFFCTRLPYWSNPGLTYNSAPMGIPAGTNSSGTCVANVNNPPCDADDHRTLNETALAVSNFRPSVLTVTSLTPSVPSPVAVGTPVTWTAVAAGGAAPYTYKFLLFDGTTWTVARDWSASNQWTWTTTAPGSYTIQVWARNSGSTADYDAWLGAAATVSGPPPVTVTSLGSTPQGSSLLGTPVTWTATASGGTGPYTYKFVLYNGSTWSIEQDWSSSNSWTWTAANAGTYNVQVWVRNAGSASVYDAWRGAGPFVVAGPASLALTALTSDQTFPTPAGTPVTWSVNAAGGTPPYAYKFLVFDGSMWTVGRDWSAANSWTWMAPMPGTYNVQVWVRNAGSANPFDAWRGVNPFVVTASAPLSVGNLIADHAFPTPAGTAVAWSVTASGGVGPYSYKFWIYDGSTWSIGRDWGAANTWTWLTPAAGSYNVQVWIRNAGSSATFDGWRGTVPLTVTAPAPLSVTSFTASSSVLTPPSPIVLSANATGGTGPYQFKFFVFNGSTWAVGRDWDPSATWTWAPALRGTYSFQVWVRNAGSNSTYDAWAPLGPLIVQTP